MTLSDIPCDSAASDGRVLTTCAPLLCFQAVNPIGVRRKDHKYGVLTGRIINLPPQLRDRQDQILLLALYSCKHAKKLGGESRMICGIHQETGEEYDERSFRRDLLELMAGVPFMIPDDVNGGLMPIICECHFLGMSLDLLGAAQIGPWPQSFQATHPCLDCWWHSRCWCAHLPADSQELDSGEPHAEGCRNGTMVLRTQAGFFEDNARLRATQFSSKAARNEALRCAGVSKVHCGLMYIPGAVMTLDARKDTMHLLWCGLTRHESYWMLDDLIPDCFSWDQLNERRKLLQLPKGHRIPELANPKKDGTSKAATSMNLKAVEMMHFTLYRWVPPPSHIPVC